MTVGSPFAFIERTQCRWIVMGQGSAFCERKKERLVFESTHNSIFGWTIPLRTTQVFGHLCANHFVIIFLWCDPVWPPKHPNPNMCWRPATLCFPAGSSWCQAWWLCMRTGTLTTASLFKNIPPLSLLVVTSLWHVQYSMSSIFVPLHLDLEALKYVGVIHLNTGVMKFLTARFNLFARLTHAPR